MSKKKSRIFALSLPIGSARKKPTQPFDHVTQRPMESALGEWVRDTAVEFGFKRGWVKPLEIGADPWEFCKFEVLGITYEVHDCALSIVKQDR